MDVPNLDFELTQQQNYQNYIKNFVVPTENSSRIGKDISGLMEFDYVDQDDENYLDGHLQKRFVMLDKQYFSRYFDMIKNNLNSNSYVSYLDPMNIGLGEIPKNLSVLVKEISLYGLFDDYKEVVKVFGEVFAPKILNYFGCKTVCNAFCDNGNNSLYVLSLDFIKHDCEYIPASLVDDNLEVSGSCFMGENLSCIDEKIFLLKNMARLEGFGEISCDNQAIKENYIKSYLVRTLLLGDGDFHTKNYGFIIDKKDKKIIDAPNHDFEFLFTTIFPHMLYSRENIEYIIKNYPEIMSDFLKKLQDCFYVFDSNNKNLFRSMMEYEIGQIEICDEIYKFVKYCADEIVNETSALGFEVGKKLGE